MHAADENKLNASKTEHERTHYKRLWECDYGHDRRKHRHRCQCCRKIVKEGEAVTMYRFGDKKTRVLHIECADIKPLPESSWTYRDLALVHAYSERLN